jgi:hypothetical protein
MCFGLLKQCRIVWTVTTLNPKGGSILDLMLDTTAWRLILEPSF